MKNQNLSNRTELKEELVKNINFLTELIKTDMDLCDMSIGIKHIADNLDKLASQAENIHYNFRFE